ncbi:MAG: glycosyltransferase [Bryobacteraceae bacterium]|nr:glycosyltransferase [Bryobacteraceae bacterium]
MSSRVILLTTNLAEGGAERQVASLARGLVRRGWEVQVISLVEPSAFREELKTAGVPVFSLRMQPGCPDPRGYLRLLALLGRLRPQILHCHMFHANLLGRLSRLLCPVPGLISTLHSMAETGQASRSIFWRDKFYRWTDCLSDMTVAVAQAVAERHANAGAVHRGKLRVIPNGIDTTVFRPDEEFRRRVRRALGFGEEFLWLAAGRLMWKKGYGLLLEAFASLSQGVLLIAGSGPLEQWLRQQAEELRVNVRFLGHRRDMPDLMRACDAFVQASVVEGLPMALLEASASALPCVATSAGGAGEVMIHGRTGFLVEAGDPESLAGAMKKLAAMPVEERRRMGEAARAHVLARFEMESVISQWEALYRELESRWM